MSRFDAWYEAMSNERGDAPDIRVLWNRASTARKYYHCDLCGGEITPGERYSSTGLIEDGVFRHERMHDRAIGYPSGCPSIGAKERAENDAQFEADRAQFFPTHQEQSNG
ncbi:hypothetical protein S2M10_29690 [Sphingomonas sp. S2M10]|uniref:hypothetical protein n=1 Tax=Sphingomonas sp. S2M10 TaxID=2705010 RepID=UPI00145646F7|nr:hypothetical protein [Sphingomonas sp. S2M10]NLS27967.1 hypothetical protein [Sphingomonas sp. S2M10]